MALRTIRARVISAGPESAIETTKSDSSSLSEASIGSPSRVAGPSSVATKVSRRIGSWITPTTGRPASTSAIETQKNGMPLA